GRGGTGGQGYGGGAWTVSDGPVYFSNFADGRLYRLPAGATQPEPLTPVPATRGRDWRFADGVIDKRRNRWIGVREDHTQVGPARLAHHETRPGQARG